MEGMLQHLNQVSINEFFKALKSLGVKRNYICGKSLNNKHINVT